MPTIVRGPAPTASASGTPWRLLRQAQRLAPRQRLRDCSRFPAAPARLVEVYHDPARPLGRLAGLQRCGDVWACPRCATYAGRRRGEQLTTEIQAAVDRGLTVHVVTLTVRHDAAQPLLRVVDQLGRARRFLFQCRAWRRLAAAYGFLGSVRALEVTHGEHGWHVHTHEVLFFHEPPPNLVTVVMSEWQAATKRAGTYAHPVHGARVDPLDVATPDRLARYVCQWGAGNEVAGQSMKRATAGHRTPWDLLRSAIAGDPYAATRWTEYAVGMAGRQRLHASPRLRSVLAALVEDLPPEEPAAATESLVAILEPDEWQTVVLTGAEHDLCLAAAMGRQQVHDLLRNLAERAPPRAPDPNDARGRPWPAVPVDDR